MFVSPNNQEAMTIADRIAVVHESRIEELGPPFEIYDVPANLSTAGFVGSPVDPSPVPDRIDLFDAATGLRLGSAAAAGL
jgi:ABC-type sulfate/molybdate transport systems ATPase subunit